MKFSKQQIETLAQVIRRKLLEKYTVPETKVKELTLLLKKIEEVKIKEKKLIEESNKISDKIKKVSGITNTYHIKSMQTMLNIMKDINTTSVNTIEEDIMLQSIFSTEKDLELFMESIISKYSK